MVLASCLAAHMAAAQAQPSPRPFDRVSGILIACAPATGFAWTATMCDRLTAEMRKRAEPLKLKLAIVPLTADISRKKFDMIEGFDGDKAVRVRWTFEESKSTKGQISAGLSSNFIYEPTTKDHPNIAPGQRIPMNFYAQSVLFDPGVSLSQAEPFLMGVLDSFFKVGDRKI